MTTRESGVAGGEPSGPESGGLRVVVRPLRVGDEADEQALLDIFNASFGRWPPFDVPVDQREFLRWWLEDHGATRGDAELVEVYGRPLNAGAGMIRPALVRGEARTARIGSYRAVHPDGRGMGLYRLTRERARDATELSWGFSQVAQVQHMRQVLGDLELRNRLSVFIRVLSPLDAARARGQGRVLANAVGYLGMQLRGRLAYRRAQREPWSVRRIEAFDQRVDAMAEAAATEFDFILLRTAEFLNWRYLDPRAGGFTALVAEHGDELLGYSVLRMIEGRGHIADLLVVPGRADVARSLIDASVVWLREAGASAVECTMMLHHPYTPHLRRAGFVVAKGRSDEMTRKFSLMPRSMSSTDLAFLTAETAKIHMVLGDSDMI